MTYPITGPILRQINVEPILYVETQKWRQRRPYNLPLKYITIRRLNSLKSPSGTPYLSASGSFNSNASAFLLTDSVSGDVNVGEFILLRDQARNKAVGKFNSKRGEKAALAVALAEARQSISMITTRATQLARLGLAIAKLNFHQAGIVLNEAFNGRVAHRKPKSLRRTSHSFANNWLEYSFGWKPMIGDMYTAMEVLQARLHYDSPVKAGASISRTLTIGRPIPGDQYAQHTCTAWCSVGAVLRVENPNLDLIQRLGLANPAMVAYELTKFSFVLNWFVNVEEYLSQYNEFWGVSVINPYYSDKFSDDTFVLHRDWSDNPDYLRSGTMTGRSFMRTPGSLPAIRLGLRPAFRLPLTRALNAISLLIQQGVGKR